MCGDGGRGWQGPLGWGDASSYFDGMGIYGMGGTVSTVWVCMLLETSNAFPFVAGQSEENTTGSGLWFLIRGKCDPR